MFPIQTFFTEDNHRIKGAVCIKRTLRWDWYKNYLKKISSCWLRTVIFNSLNDNSIYYYLLIILFFRSSLLITINMRLCSELLIAHAKVAEYSVSAPNMTRWYILFATFRVNISIHIHNFWILSFYKNRIKRAIPTVLSM